MSPHSFAEQNSFETGRIVSKRDNDSTQVLILRLHLEMRVTGRNHISEMKT